MQRRSETSRALVARTSPFTQILGYLLPSGTRTLFIEWYAYLRWVDDQVDDASLNTAEAAAFIQRQQDLMHDQDLVPPMTAEEARFRAILSSQAESSRAEVSRLVCLMLECMAFDGRRRGTLSSYEELRTYWRKEVSAYLGAIAFCCGIASKTELSGIDAAVGAKTAHVLRDLRSDLSIGQINISTEECEAFHVEPQRASIALESGAADYWIVANARIARLQLANGLEDIRSSKSLRYKLIVILLVTKYQAITNSIVKHGADKVGVGATFFSHASLLACNAAAVFLGQPTHRDERTVSPAIQASPWMTAKLLVGVLPGLGARDGDAVTMALSLTVDVPADARLRRRFRVASLIGRLSLSAVSPEASRIPALVRTAGLLYGFWSICAIEMDRLMDEGALTRETSRVAGDAWLALLRRTLSGEPIQPAGDALASHGVFAALTTAFMGSLRDFAHLCELHDLDWRPSIREDFYSAASMLMAGQLRSLDQMEVNPERNWSWYRKHILNAKNVEFLLAPFNLWRVGTGSDDRLKSLVEQFHHLNRLYLHYQLIDDVADLREDSSEGIIGAAGALLLSQGALADRLLTPETEIPSEAPAFELPVGADDIASSGLLAEGLANAALFDLHRHHFLDHAAAQSQESLRWHLVCALANKKQDLIMDVGELARVRQVQAQAYLDSLRGGNAIGAVNCVLDSAADQRITNAVGNPAPRWRLKRSIRAYPNANSIELLSVLERMMRHTLRAAHLSSRSARSRDTYVQYHH